MFELSYDRHLAMCGRRAADLFDLVSMFSTREPAADAADFEVNAAADFLKPQ